MQDLGYSVKAEIKSYKDLIVWQRAIDLAAEVYTLSALFPKEEQYGMISQLRRAACSVSLNIAEGYGRNTTKSYINSLYIAKGSLQEVESAIILSIKLGLSNEIACKKANDLITEEFKMLHKLISTLEDRI